MIGLAIPPRAGEADASYYARVCDTLSPPWWYDHRYRQIGTSGYVPMIYDGDIERLSDASLRVLSAYTMPHMVLLFNEPERADQANMTPGQAATAYRRWIARVPPWLVSTSVGGVNVSTQHGKKPYAWLEAFLSLLSDDERGLIQSYHIHVYGGAACLYDGVRAFREWMLSHDGVKPLIVSECGTADNPAALMRELHAMLQDGIIAQAAWFAAYYDAWNDTGLLDASGTLTEAGKSYVAQSRMQYTTRLPYMAA